MIFTGSRVLKYEKGMVPFNLKKNKKKQNLKIAVQSKILTFCRRKRRKKNLQKKNGGIQTPLYITDDHLLASRDQ